MQKRNYSNSTFPNRFLTGGLQIKNKKKEQCSDILYIKPKVLSTHSSVQKYEYNLKARHLLFQIQYILYTI